MAFSTVAVKGWVEPIATSGRGGEILTTIAGKTVIVALPEAPGSSRDVAVTVTYGELGTAGGAV
jgi:hypothetical protein